LAQALCKFKGLSLRFFMEQGHPDDVAHKGMLRMIRSARSRLNKEAEDPSAAFTGAVADGRDGSLTLGVHLPSRWRLETGTLHQELKSARAERSESVGCARPHTSLLQAPALGSSSPTHPVQRLRSDQRPLNAHDAQQPPNDRALKRVSQRSTFGGVGRPRLARSRSTADALLASHGASENAIPSLQQADAPPLPPPSQPMPHPTPQLVLSDVTNTAGHTTLQQPAKLHLQADPEARCVKPCAPAAVPEGGVQQPGAAVPSAPPLAPRGATSRAGPRTSVVGPPVPSPEPHARVANDTAQDMEVDLVGMDVEDPQVPVEYLADIYRHLDQEEAQRMPRVLYMERQTHVNAKMRAILIDWLVDVHKKYKLQTETLFLATSVVDGFLEHRVVQRRHLQLVGVTGLLIASKFEEMYPPQINDFVYVTAKAYTKEEVARMEVSMLNALDFKLCHPTAAHFLARFQRANSSSEAHRDLSQYLLELTLVDYKMIRYGPSHLAAASVLLSNKLLRRQPCWPASVVRHTKMTEAALKDCAKEICALLEQAESNPLQAVRKKFSQQKYHAVAKLNFTAAPSYVHAREGTRRNSVRRSTANASGQDSPTSGQARLDNAV